MSGWFKVQRGWMNSPDFAKEPFTEREAWLWLIEAAAYDPHVRHVSGHSVSLSRGQLIVSQRTLADVWKWGRQRVRGFIARLELLGSLTQNSTHGLTQITVCNYEKYQGEQPSLQPSSNPAATQQQPIKEEGKEIKKEKNGARGTRLPTEFSMPTDWLDWAVSEKRWGLKDAREEAANFIDYWHSKPGAGGIKTDWLATWRNWVRNSRRQKKVMSL